MALRFSLAIRHGMLAQIETLVGGSPKLRLYSGTPPTGGTSDAATGTMLCEITLPADWLTSPGSPSNGQVGKNNSWQGQGHANAGAGTSAGYFRVYRSDGTTCDVQGTVTASGGGGDMTMNNISIAENQSVEVTAATLTAGNA